jgi:prophage antirepressor-like protein
MNDMMQRSFEGHQVRVLERDGEPWFVLGDVCRVLEIGNPSDAARRLDDDERGVDTVETLGGSQAVNVVNESGLYSLILTSRKEAARRFKRWVTSEVLPSIRKHGGYVANQETLSPAELLAKAVLVAHSVIAEKEARIAHLEPIAAVAEEVFNLDRLTKVHEFGRRLDGVNSVGELAAGITRDGPAGPRATLKDRGWPRLTHPAMLISKRNRMSS